MDFFERAHVQRKSPSKMEKKTDEAVKRQLKQMMTAYKRGNNQDIQSSSEIKPKYDFDETISISDFSEFSASKDSENSRGTVSCNASNDLQSSSVSNSSKSISIDTGEASSEDITECCEEFKALSTSLDESASTSFGNSSAVFGVSDSDDSDLSLPSSLQTSTGSGTDMSDYDFDADGSLASKILENLSKNDKVSKKRKIPKEIELELRKDVNITKGINTNEVIIKKKSKKPKQETINNSTEYFLEEDVDEFEKEMIFKEALKDRKQPPLKQPQHITELSDDSVNNSMDSAATSFSSPFISVSAENMSSSSLGDILGDYVHPTIRNLPADIQSVPNTTASMFSADEMIVKDIVDDEISSLIPEVDEDLAVEDLNLDTDTQELINESNTFNNSIPTEELTLPQSTSMDDTLDNELVTEESVPITVYNGNNKYVMVMKHPAELYIHGKLQIADINGSVEIFGYKLNYDCIEVYAPYCSFAHCLKTLENPHPINPDLYNELMSAGLSTTDAKEVVSSIEDSSAVVILSKLNSGQIDFTDNNFSNTDLFSKRSDHTPRFLKKAAEGLGCSFYMRPPKRSFVEKSVWENVYTSTREGSRGIICGGKGTGKSTFLRHYVNTLLADGPVLVIDLDPGQAEFTIPGNISATIVERPLVGPNFTHLKTPEISLNIGIINTMDNAKRYLNAVSDLVASCRVTEAFRDLPWVINTMGLCNHMGLKFMTFIILLTQPTFLFQIDSNTPKKRFETELDSLNVTQLYEKYYSNNREFRNIQSVLKYSFVIARHEETSSPVGSSLLPRDERYLNILAYFGEMLNDNRPQGLMEIVPYEVNLKDLNIGLNVKIPADSVAKVINGKIIALCQQNAHDKGTVFTLGDKALLCHGHGLIRGIDFERGLLYILTPTHIDKLSLVDTLVYSDWMPELRGLEKDLSSGTPVPYRTANTASQHRKLMFPPRRRFNPLQLLKMSRNS